LEMCCSGAGLDCLAQVGLCVCVCRLPHQSPTVVATHLLTILFLHAVGADVGSERL